MNRTEPRLFISYRRADSAREAGRLYDAITRRLGVHNVFMDIDLRPGTDFVERIRQAVSACDVMLVLVGPRWATVEASDGLPRLADPEDFVRLEVEAGLHRPNVAVIPVLVAGARMPEPEHLPLGMRPLLRLKAPEISDSRWRYDLDRLLDALENTFETHHR
jgi:TIR domain